MELRSLSTDELERAAETLRYEVQMFVSTASMLERWSLGRGDLLNAVLESFLVHMRQLIEFLTEMNDGWRGRDVRAAHFCDDTLLENWKTDAARNRKDLVGEEGSPGIKDAIDRQVVHLTAERGTIHKTTWNTSRHRQDLVRRLAYWAAGFATKLDFATRRWLLSLREVRAVAIQPLTTN